MGRRLGREEPTTKAEVRDIVSASRAGENVDRTVDRFFAAAYPDLRSIARRFMAVERQGNSLNPTALVHEAYIRLFDESALSWNDRTHFLGIVARVMRRVLVDESRKRLADKRGGGWRRLNIDATPLATASASLLDVLALDQALERLATESERAARVAELRLFAAMPHAAIAEAVGVSERTARNDWTMARMWLARELASDGSAS